MPIRVTALDGRYAELAAWTGESADEIKQAVEDHHAEPRDHWLAWQGDQVVGALHPWRSPDGRLRLFFDRCLPAAYAPLLEKVDGPCVTDVDAAAEETLTALQALGFAENRREQLYELPVRFHDVGLPADTSIVSAADVSAEALMDLDCRLRDDVPGSEGWQPDLEWFREENHDSPYFDPQAYLVARANGQDVGLVRIWNGPRSLPRLGLIAVLPGYRQRGIARALLAQAINTWHQRGGTTITAEVDAGNQASNALLTAFGGRVTGATIELAR